MAFTLDQIREATEKQYGSYDIELSEGRIVRLRNMMRLPLEERRAVAKMQDRLGEDDIDQADVIRDVMRAVAEDKYVVEELISAVGDDLGVLVTIFKEYVGGTQAGEA